MMCRTVKPQKILEVGCAIGYSSILMAQATDDDCEIATLECNEDMVRIARENIEKLSGYAAKKYRLLRRMQRIIFRILTMMKIFDMIFLDGPKAHYIYMLDECVRLL